MEKHWDEEPVNVALKGHQVVVEDWELNPVAKELYEHYGKFNQEFFDGLLGTPLISFTLRRQRNLGHYVNGRNDIGCYDNININPVHLNGTKQDTLETLLHEMVHQWQYKVGKPGKNNYHNYACRAKMQELGIPCDKKGVTVAVRDPFVSFPRSQGIDGQYWELPSNGALVSGNGSKLKKWVCDCKPQYGVRVAIKDFEAVCIKCSQKFRQVK